MGAYATSIRLVSCVYPFVSGEMRRLTKFFSTNITFIRFFASVRAIVLCKLTCILESLLTNFAFEWTFTCIIWKEEIETLEFTFIVHSSVGYLTCVNPHVNGQLTFIPRDIWARCAQIWLMLSPMFVIVFSVLESLAAILYFADDLLSAM